MVKTPSSKKNFYKRLRTRLNQSLQRAEGPATLVESHTPIDTTSNQNASLNLQYSADGQDNISIFNSISYSNRSDNNNEIASSADSCEDACGDLDNVNTCSIASVVNARAANQCILNTSVVNDVEPAASRQLVETIDSKLARWAVTEKIPQSSLKKLLSILREEPIYKDTLPKDPRSLLKTPRAKCVQPMSTGFYYYFGLAESLNNLCLKYNIKIVDNQVFFLAINIDGLPISKSTNTAFWPILCSVKSVVDLKNKVFPIALYCGDQKPTADELLRDFVNECNDLATSGLFINSVKCDFRICMLICDAPAKSYVLSIKGHSGYYSCTKCMEEGELINNVMCFEETENYVLRTDRSFRELDNPEHHTGNTLFTSIPNFHMIDNVPIDYMHNLLLGGTKRFLCSKRYGWIFGKPPYKLRARDVKKMSDYLAELKKCIPCEFARKTRPINECKRYKAVEFRLLLLYTGMFIFKDVLSSRMYNNFMKFSLASIILISNYYSQYEEYISFAHTLMQRFIRSSIRIYGPDFIAHNIHNCLHLSDCVRLFGSLDNCSAFEFENYLKDLKGMLRKNDLPLQQIVRRIIEDRNILEVNTPVHTTWPKLLKRHNAGPLTNNCTFPQYKKVQNPEYCFDVTKIADRFAKLNDDTIVEIKNIATFENTTVLIGYKYNKQNDFFSKPCASSLYEIHYIQKHDNELKMWSLDSISKKLVIMKYKGRYVSMPLWHL